jgi:hypothetical protein
MSRLLNSKEPWGKGAAKAGAQAEEAKTTEMMVEERMMDCFVGR